MPRSSLLLLFALFAPRVAAAETQVGERLFQLDARLAFGVGKGFEDAKPRFAGELAGMMRIGLEPYSGSGLVWVLMPEVAAGATAGDDAGGETSSDVYFAAGAGVGLANDTIVLGLVPSFVAGQFGNGLVERRFGMGARLLAEIELIRFIGIQGAVLGALFDGELRTEARATVSLNFWPLLRILGR